MIALTGYTGFIGQHLLEQLKQYDCLLLGRNRPASDYQFCELDLESIDKSALFESLKPVSTLIHLAGRAHVISETSANSLLEYRTINTLGTLELAKQAAKAGVKRFIYISSIKVNGERTANNVRFTDKDIPAPEDAYGISKAEAEHQLMLVGDQTGMEIVIIRPPLVYGEGVKANFAKLMNLIGKGAPLPFRLIHNKRSLLSVYNLADFICVCITHPKAANQVFLVSDDNDLSTAQMVALLAQVQGKKNIALPVPMWCFTAAGKILNKMDVVDKLTDSLQLDITHTKNTLDWSPPYSAEHGFKLAAKPKQSK